MAFIVWIMATASSLTARLREHGCSGQMVTSFGLVLVLGLAMAPVQAIAFQNPADTAAQAAEPQQTAVPVPTAPSQNADSPRVGSGGGGGFPGSPT